MFGHKKVPTRTYACGVLAISGAVDAFNEQLWLGHKYRNALVDIELLRREEYLATLSKYSPVYGAAVRLVQDLEAELAAAIAKLNKARKRARARLPEEESPRLLKTIRAELNDAKKACTAAKAEARETLDTCEEYKAEQAENSAKDMLRRKSARKHCGLYHGTYTEIEMGFASARSGAPPRKRKFDGSGKIAVQFKRGRAVPTMLTVPCREFSTSPINPIAFTGATKFERKVARVTPAKIRVCSDKRKPVMLSIDVIWHRPIPDDGVVKWAILRKKRVGPTFRYYLHFRVARESGWAKPDVAPDGAVGIDIGWRKLANGNLRVAYWKGSDGDFGEVVLTPRQLGGWDRWESLQGIRDTNFNAIVAMLRDWKAKQTNLPKWFVEGTKYIHLWKEPRSLVRLLRQWRESRMSNDEEIFGLVTDWRTQDDHLWAWEVNQRRKTSEYRLHTYRQLAADLRRRYSTFILEDINWSDFAKKHLPETDQSEAAYVNRHVFRMAAPGLMKGVLVESGATVQLVDPRRTTMICHGCGSVEHFDQAKMLVHTCSICNLTWDQDYNAACNLLATDMVMLAGGE